MNYTALSPDDDFQADGNLFWSLRDGPKQAGDLCATFRQSPLFEASKQRYAPGLGASDGFADPKFASLDADGKQPFDPRLGAGSAAIGGGIALPDEWPDPLRSARPDIGALPHGLEPWNVGVRGRIHLGAAPEGNFVITAPQ